MRPYRALLILAALASAAFGQTTVPDAPAETPSIQSIEQRRDALDESQQDARTLYDEAIKHLERAAASTETAARRRADAAAAPARLASIREELLQPPTDPVPTVPPDATLTQLEQGQAEAIAALEAARDLVNQLRTESNRRQARRDEILATLPTRRQDLTRVEDALKMLPSEEAEDPLVQARRTALLAEQRELLAKIDELEAERTSYDARRDLLPARRDQAARRVTETEKLVSAWREIVGARRQLEAAQSARDAERLRRTAASQHPVLQAYAAETKLLAEERTGPTAIPQRIAAASQQAEEVRRSFADLRQRYNAVQRRIDASGLDRATGLMLRREYESLPDLQMLKRRVTTTRNELEDIEYTLFERQDSRVGSDDINRIRRELLEQIADGTEITPDLEAVATELVSARRDVLAELENDADRYQDVLVELGRESERLLEATTSYESFIRERILWVRSIAGKRQNILEEFKLTFAWIADPETWANAIGKTRDDALRRYATVAVSVAVLVSFFALGRWSKRRIATLADLVGRYRTDRFKHTLAAVALTVAISIPFPATIWWLGWILVRPTDQVPIAVSLGTGLQAAAQLLLPLALLRNAIRRNGLAAAHFRWPSQTLAMVRRNLRWFVPTIVPLIALVTMIEDSGEEVAIASLGRVAFTAAMLAFAVFLQRILNPRGLVTRDWLKEHQGGWIDRLRYIWYPALIAIPIIHAILGWMGFFYTALQLESRVESTIALFLLLLLLNSILVRWLFLARRRVAFEEAKRRRDQALAAESEAAPPAEDSPKESSLPPIDEDTLDLPSISLQTRQLFRITVWVAAILGLYAIWADVLPALRMLDRVEIYPNQRIVETSEDNTIPSLESDNITPTVPQATPTTTIAPPQATTSTSTPSILGVPPTSGQPAPDTATQTDGLVITLADIGLAILVLVATYLAFRNLPGLIEIMILQRLPLDAGSRYALSTVLRYTIALIGIAAAFGALSISWSNIQWLAAALTFGLAFGLQEIFANFISGLIILAERPIRIGDTVTIGNVNGTVTRIRMRATTVTDWDRKELIIPNKTFITGEVINWTLSDPLLRLIIPVGVSYSTDVNKAESVLLEVASNTPNVLKDPKPYVLFTRFGDSTLEFELRLFIPSIDHVISVKHAAHMRIIEAFRQANIEIAFPQRDLHLRSAGELRDLIVKKDDRDAPNAQPPT